MRSGIIMAAGETAIVLATCSRYLEQCRQRPFIHASRWLSQPSAMPTTRQCYRRNKRTSVLPQTAAKIPREYKSTVGIL